MSDAIPTTMLQLRSELKSTGELALSFAEVDVPKPRDHEVLVRIEATPINPSDLGLLLGGADVTRASAGGTAERPTISAPVPENMLRAMKARLDQSLPVGNEAGGVVVAAGSSPEAQALVGKVVGILGGAMYAGYRAVPAAMCLPLRDGTNARQAASCFVNPLTALGMTETMRLEGYKALVHTAAASNLGQMLQKICSADGIELVNIVRKPEQVELLQGIGAKHVCNSSDEDFMARLIDALAETEATIAFDATGGGDLASRILTCMEAAAARNAPEFSRYGTDVHKQVYIYGGLDRSPTVLTRSFGFAWGIGGWLLTPFLQRIGPERAQALRERVADEIDTTFASHYSKVISLREALSQDALSVYSRQATGEKYLIDPTLD